MREKARAPFTTRKLSFLNEFHVSSASPQLFVPVPNKSIMFPGQRLSKTHRSVFLGHTQPSVPSELSTQPPCTRERLRCRWGDRRRVTRARLWRREKSREELRAASHHEYSPGKLFGVQPCVRDQSTKIKGKDGAHVS